LVRIIQFDPSDGYFELKQDILNYKETNVT